MAAKNTRYLDEGKQCAYGPKVVGRTPTSGLRWPGTVKGRRTSGAHPIAPLFSQEFGYGFGAGADLKFFVDSANIGVDGFVADAEFFGDFFVEKAMAEAIENFLFALGKIFGRLWRRTGLLKGLGDFAGNVRGHRRAAAMNFANGFQQFGGFSAFEEVAVCARGQCTEDIFRIFINREHDNLKFGNELF